MFEERFGGLSRIPDVADSLAKARTDGICGTSNSTTTRSVILVKNAVEILSAITPFVLVLRLETSHR